jgi:hypothetical protein
MGRRIGAWLIDFVIGGVVLMIGFTTLVDGTRGIEGNACPDSDSGTETAMCWDSFGTRDGLFVYDEATDESFFLDGSTLWRPWALFVAYGVLTFVVIEGLAGASIGKLIVGLRVVRSDGRAAGLPRAAVRFALWIVDAFPYCFPLVGLIAGGSSSGHRRVGDMLAGTFVVGTAFAGRPLTIPGLTPPASAPVGPATPYGAPAPFGGEGQPGAPLAWGSTPPKSHIDNETSDATAPQPATSIEQSGTITPAGTAPPEGPQWDAARNTYLQHDPVRGWLQWDAAAEEWKPVE